MNVVRKTMKVFLFSVIFFFILSVILAFLIKVTPLKEEWGLYGLIILLALTTMIAGYIEGCLIGKRGLITGAIIAITLIVFVIFTVGTIYNSPLSLSSFKGEYFIAVVSGIIGAVIGTNNSK